MKLKDILSISGKPGLYKFISQARNGIIVESFADGKRMAVQNSAKVSALEDIAIFTETDEIPLKEVFKKLFEKTEGKATISNKASNDELKKLMEDILPDYDRERVYVSDIKKLVNWFNILTDLELLSIVDEEEKAAEAAQGASSEEEKAE